MILRIENLIYNKTQFIKYFFIVFSFKRILNTLTKLKKSMPVMLVYSLFREDTLMKYCSIHVRRLLTIVDVS